jgi:glutaredoxin
VGWAAVGGGGAITGVGFTVSLLIASLAFHNIDLERAKFGILCAAVFSSLITWVWFAVVARMPKYTRIRLLLGGSEMIVDLADPVDPERDHIRGPADASVTVVEYGDFQCPYCGQAEPVVRDLLADADIRYVWRNLPLTDVHPQAQMAAQAAEAAGLQGKFWEMHDLLFAHQDRLRITDVLGYARDLALDEERFHDDVMRRATSDRIAADLESADLSGVSGTPTFFINGRRHYGAYDVHTLKEAIRLARVRARIAQRRR